MDERFISQRITQLRLQRNISEYRLSMELGKSVGYVQAISSGRSLPSVEQLYNIADYFGMTVSEFLDPGNQDPPAVRAAVQELRRLGEEDARLILCGEIKPGGVSRARSILRFQGFLNVLKLKAPCQK